MLLTVKFIQNQGCGLFCMDLCSRVFYQQKLLNDSFCF